MKEYFGKPIKKLGFGLMRLPFLGKDEGSELDLVQIKQMVDLYLAHGYSYFDTAYLYHQGHSEVAFRQAVSERYPREAFQLTTKLPLWKPLTFAEMRAITTEQLTRTGLDHFDLYFLHGIGGERLPMLEEMKAWDYLQSVKADGLANNVGFSYHGNAEALNRILDARQPGEIDIVQLQLNYLDWNNPSVQSRLCYEAVVNHGIGVIAMEPVKGGCLADFSPEVAAILKAADPTASLASWALRFVMELPGVVTVLSGMSTLDQVVDNLQTADNFQPLSADDLVLLEEVTAGLAKVPTIPCTACRYCLDDCPEHINTPRIIQVLNDYTKYRNLLGAKRQYGFATGGGNMSSESGPVGKSSDCQQCGVCEEHCPQHIKIIQTHEQAVQLFE